MNRTAYSCKNCGTDWVVVEHFGFRKNDALCPRCTHKAEGVPAWNRRAEKEADQ